MEEISVRSGRYKPVYYSCLIVKHTCCRYRLLDLVGLISDFKASGYQKHSTPGASTPGHSTGPVVQYTTAYDASIIAQAGHTSFTKNMNIDTRNKVIGQSNLNAQTALTYIATADGGNVVGSENLMIDGAGARHLLPTGCFVRLVHNLRM